MDSLIKGFKQMKIVHTKAISFEHKEYRFTHGILRVIEIKGKW
jgi:hypothetical protein